MKKSNIITVANDAGGAEIISALIKKDSKKNNYISYISGPAKKIFSRKKLTYKNALDFRINALNKIDFVLTGTSGQSEIERQIIKAAKAKNIKTISFIDHWVHYRERFGYPSLSWEKNLPDEIWVGDKVAFKLAKELFNTTVKFYRNPYIDEVKNTYKLTKTKKIRSSILFISEPLNLNDLSYKSNEYLILEDIIKAMIKSKFRILTIRPHPSENRNKYAELVKKYKSVLKIHTSKYSLINDLKKADLVIGMESMALVVADVCNKKILCIIPENKSKFALPIRALRIKKEQIPNYL